MSLGILIAIVGGYLYWKRGLPLYLLAAGVGLGSFLRDLHWYRGMRNTWKFVCETTDWKKVQEIADSDDAGNANPPDPAAGEV